MNAPLLLLQIVSPVSVIFQGEVTVVRCPGTQDPFTVLPLHAPIISSLRKGKITWVQDGNEGGIDITGGFVEVLNNHVWICVVQ